MQIAISSQNRRSITGHAGKCRNFWIYEISAGQVTGKQLIELERTQSLHESAHCLAEPLSGINVLISGGMGEGLYRRLLAQGIQPLLTEQTDPDASVAAFLEGQLTDSAALRHAACHHDHAH